MTVQPKFPETLRALSIAGPYAYEIATGEKLSEGRSWRTNFRGLVLLHVSTGREYGAPQSKEMISAIIGAAEVYSCTPSAIYEGYYNHWMRNPVLFKKFIPDVLGARNYWAAKTPEHIHAFDKAWKQLQEQAPGLIQTSKFKIQVQNGVIKIDSIRTTTAFEVADDDIWRCFQSRIKGGEIALTKSEFKDLYCKRLA